MLEEEDCQLDTTVLSSRIFLTSPIVFAASISTGKVSFSKTTEKRMLLDASDSPSSVLHAGECEFTLCLHQRRKTVKSSDNLSVTKLILTGEEK
eukprot:753544-Hanusia_phi.AAC.1